MRQGGGEALSLLSAYTRLLERDDRSTIDKYCFAPCTYQERKAEGGAFCSWFVLDAFPLDRSFTSYVNNLLLSFIAISLIFVKCYVEFILPFLGFYFFNCFYFLYPSHYFPTPITPPTF